MITHFDIIERMSESESGQDFYSEQDLLKGFFDLTRVLTYGGDSWIPNRVRQLTEIMRESFRRQICGREVKLLPDTFDFDESPQDLVFEPDSNGKLAYLIVPIGFFKRDYLTQLEQTVDVASRVHNFLIGDYETKTKQEIEESALGLRFEFSAALEEESRKRTLQE